MKTTPIIILIFLFSLTGHSQTIQRFREVDSPSHDVRTITFRRTGNTYQVWRSVVTTSGEYYIDAKTCDGRFHRPEGVNQDHRPGAKDGCPVFAECMPNWGVFSSNRDCTDDKDCNDIYEMIQENDTWTIRKIDAVSSKFWDDTPALSQYCDVMYFASNRTDKRLRTRSTARLYYSMRSANGWSVPKLCFPDADDNVIESSPCVGSDGYLYFSRLSEAGDFRIHRVFLEANGIPSSDSVEDIDGIYKGVNKHGSNSFPVGMSPDTRFLLFSSNRGGGKYGIHYFPLKQNGLSETIDIVLTVSQLTQDDSSELARAKNRTLIIQNPCPAYVTVRNDDSDCYCTYRTDLQGNLRMTIPRFSSNSLTCMGRFGELIIDVQGECCSAGVTHRLQYDLLCSAPPRYDLHVWCGGEVKTPQIIFPERPNIPFFATGYWVPTTSLYKKYALLGNTVFDPIRNNGCMDLKEATLRKLNWSVKVDNLIESMTYWLSKNILDVVYIANTLQQGGFIEVEVIGWTDERRLVDDKCVYNGRDIVSGAEGVELTNITRYDSTGVLKSGESFRGSGAGGNQLLSDLRAYYTAHLLDQIWSDTTSELSIPAYTHYRKTGQIRVKATGSSIRFGSKLTREEKRSVDIAVTVFDRNGNIVIPEYNTAVRGWHGDNDCFCTRSVTEDQRLTDCSKLLKLGQREYESGNHEDAIQYFSRVIERCAEDPTAYYLRAKAYYGINLKIKALEDYNDAIARLSDDAWMYNYRGLLFHDLNKFREAIGDFSIAVGLDPLSRDNAIFLKNRGNVYYDWSQPNKAIRDYTNSLAINPTDAEVLFNRAKAYRQIGEHQKAVSDLQAASSLGNSRARNMLLHYSHRETRMTTSSVVPVSHIENEAFSESEPITFPAPDITTLSMTGLLADPDNPATAEKEYHVSLSLEMKNGRVSGQSSVRTKDGKYYIEMRLTGTYVQTNDNISMDIEEQEFTDDNIGEANRYFWLTFLLRRYALTGTINALRGTWTDGKRQGSVNVTRIQ